MTAPSDPTSRAPLRVLVVGTSWPMETFVERLLTGLADRGPALTIRSRHRPPSPWLSRHGIRWVPGGGRFGREALVRQVRANGPADAARATVASLRSLTGDADVPADVVYAPWLNALVAEPQLFDRGVPVVTSCRGALVTIAPWDPSRPTHRDDVARVLDRATLVHCVSAHIRDEAVALGLDPARSRVIHPAVSPDAFRPSEAAPSSGPGPTRVVAVGSLIWRKDLEHALRALRQAVDDGADLTLDVVGDGPDLGHVRFAVDDLDLGRRVTLHGQLAPADVAAVLRSADVLLHASCAEGISNAVLEAMATGLAVVTTDAGGMREAVRDGIDGLVVPVRGTAEMAAALTTLAGDASLRRRLGASARQRVTDHHALADQVDAFVALLAEAAEVGAP